MVDSYIISPEDELIRRIPKDPNFIKNDGTLSSGCFKLKSGEDGVSVDIQKLTTLELSIKNSNTHIAAILLAKVPIDLGCECIHNPVQDNIAHALIKGVTPSIAKKLGSQCKIYPPLNP